MTPGAVLELLESHGIRLLIRDGFLKYRGPAGAYTDELRSLVAAHRYVFIEDWSCSVCGAIVRTLFGIGADLRCRECTPRRQEASDAAA